MTDSKVSKATILRVYKMSKTGVYDTEVLDDVISKFRSILFKAQGMQGKGIVAPIITAFDGAKTDQEKMIAIDRAIHLAHTTGFYAQHLIENVWGGGETKDKKIQEFLDELAGVSGVKEMNSELRAFWDEQQEKNIDQWLTGSGLDRVEHYLNVSLEGTVLEIGVGLGYCTTGLFHRGVKVHVLDISPLALERVKDYTVAGYLSDQLEKIPKDTFDFVISFHVSEHMSDDDLEEQLRFVLPSLKSTGIFAMFIADNSDGYSLEGIDRLKYGTMCRTLEQMKTFVKNAGGKIVWNSEFYSGHGIDVYAVHIKKNEGK